MKALLSPRVAQGLWTAATAAQLALALVAIADLAISAVRRTRSQQDAA
jgi:hypothetical protein